jgi:pimeloyl-ACP methyl ester carboxylesterase
MKSSNIKHQKSNIIPRVFRIITWVLGVLFLTALIFFIRMDFRTSDAAVNKYFDKRQVAVRIHHKPYRGHTVRYLETGDTSASKLILFVHGAPGSSDNFHRYLADSALLQGACLVSVDRLGYGYSNYGHAETSLAGQAEMVLFVMDQYRADTVYLVGHSYGGPVIAKCAVMRPGRIGGLLMLAPVNDPDSEPVFWFAHFARWRATRWLLSGANRVSGDEKLTHVGELRQMEGDWSQLQAPVVHLHGYKDWLAPKANIDFSRRHIPAHLLKMVELPDKNHFLPFTDYEMVQQALLEMMQK